MPEGDAVWRTARRLDAALRGRALTDWDLRWARWATTDLRGSVTTEVVPVGKHLLHRLDSGHTLHTHLRMEGSWRVYDRASTRSASLRRPDLRVLLGTADHWAFGLSLGMVDLVRTEREDGLVGHLGPDPLGDWDAEVVGRNLRGAVERTAGAALLDQRIVAGLGTLWVSETLWAEQIHPRRLVADLDDVVLTRVVARSAHLLREAVRGPARQTRRIYGRRGPCLRCSRPVGTVRVGTPPEDRQIYCCRGCQR